MKKNIQVHPHHLIKSVLNTGCVKWLLMLCLILLMPGVTAFASGFEVYTYGLQIGIGETDYIPMQLFYDNASVNSHINDASLADLSFGQWDGNAVNLYVTGKKAGLTTITLSNSVDSTTYDVTLAVAETAEEQSRLLNISGAHVSYKNYIEDEKTEGYYLYDMNQDNIPELIIRRGQYSADEEYEFFSYDDGIELSGTLYINHCGLYANGSGGLAICRRYMGTTSRYDVSLDSSYDLQSYTVFNGVAKESDEPDDLYEFTDTRYRLTEYSRGDLTSFNEIFASYGYSE